MYKISEDSLCDCHSFVSVTLFSVFRGDMSIFLNFDLLTICDCNKLKYIEKIKLPSLYYFTWKVIAIYIFGLSINDSII